ncbi:DUF262 domain-containing protein [Agrobacterium tumefaciens]|uniref:DUF262 domain-containing protein n=1 Tax=Agrobacterium tumefaciens TaxID=358 RepID=UPI00023A5BA6|nr:hypothetical protein AT5A_09195 [Agrobacterium tumefaciens 5A]
MADEANYQRTWFSHLELSNPWEPKGFKMKAFDVRAYSIADFAEWYADKKLDLSPEFQRRSVWSSSAKAFLADTVLRGKPFPKIILMQEFKDGKTIRVVVDGQQRLRAIFDFLNDGIKISRAHNKEHAGKFFSDLPESMKEDFLQYEVGCDVLNSAPLAELLDIFARINRYTVKLNAQELRNAAYSGFFKSAAYDLGYRYVDYWIKSGILAPSNVNRMSEAELASDLLGSFLVKVQSSKSIDSYYRNYEDEEGALPSATARLDTAIQTSASIYSDEDLKASSWKSKHMYYTLVTVIGHIQSPLNGIRSTPLPKTILAQKEKVKSVLNILAADYATYSPQASRSSAPDYLRNFIRASTLATTDAGARVTRAEYVLAALEESFGH